jgi:methionine-rich copper-binding protein CopC
MMRLKLSLALAATLLLVVPAAALAHSEITSTKPEQGARVEDAPQRVGVRFSEPPSDVRIRVVDGCGDKVSGRIAISGATATTRISRGTGSAGPRSKEAANGRWKVVVKTISSADDHLATERFGFRVAGKARCEEQEDGGGPSASETPSDPGAGSERDPDPTRPADVESGGQGPMVAAIVAGVVVAAGAAGVMTRRKKT